MAGLAEDFGGDHLGYAVGAGRQGHVLVAEGDADLADDGVGRKLLVMGAVALVVVDGPGKGGDGHDQAANRNHVQVAVWSPVPAPGGQGRLDLGWQVPAQVRGEDGGGGAGRVRDGIGHALASGSSSS